MSHLLKRITAIGKTTQKEKRVIFVGAKKSGKTTCFGCLDLACSILTHQPKSTFSYYIEEKSSGISQVASDLCQGLFPEETPSGLIFEAILHIRNRFQLSEQNIAMPFCETAGEDMESLTGPYLESVYMQKPDWQSADILNKYICDSHGYIVTLPVSETNIPWIPEEFRDTKDEPQDSYGHFVDPDLTLKRILSAVLAYKEKNKRTTPPIEGIAILPTKVDKILHFVKAHGMNLNTQEGQQQFLTTYFRQSTAVLKYYGLSKVKFFPVFVEVEKKRTPEGKVVINRMSDGKPKIVIDHANNLPSFSKIAYMELIQWVLNTFG